MNFLNATDLSHGITPREAVGLKDKILYTVCEKEQHATTYQQ
jgi:hypothetical protein